MATRDQLNGDIVRNQLVEITITCTQKKTNEQAITIISSSYQSYQTIQGGWWR